MANEWLCPRCKDPYIDDECVFCSPLSPHYKTESEIEEYRQRKGA